MGRLEPVTGRASRSRTARPSSPRTASPRLSSPRTAPLLTSRRHIDLLRVCSAIPLG
ncbi:putative leader peptide [Streptomyces sp. SID8499]|uniref:putative leader peptide n=1 Tax=Streptomyces sp. SID8499 TaxID=2706106 RepID=UPI00194282D8|nr:putative leader peptide [Streptomyces sp. SID8499]